MKAQTPPSLHHDKIMFVISHSHLISTTSASCTGNTGGGLEVCWTSRKRSVFVKETESVCEGDRQSCVIWSLYCEGSFWFNLPLCKSHTTNSQSCGEDWTTTSNSLNTTDNWVGCKNQTKENKKDWPKTKQNTVTNKNKTQTQKQKNQIRDRPPKQIKTQRQTKTKQKTQRQTKTKYRDRQKRPNKPKQKQNTETDKNKTQRNTTQSYTFTHMLGFYNVQTVYSVP